MGSIESLINGSLQNGEQEQDPQRKIENVRLNEKTVDKLSASYLSVQVTEAYGEQGSMDTNREDIQKGILSDHDLKKVGTKELENSEEGIKLEYQQIVAPQRRQVQEIYDPDQSNGIQYGR